MRTSETRPRYKIYATLLDTFRSWRDAYGIYEKYWGFTDNPPMSDEEFREQKRQELVDRINRVPFDSEAADRGTVLNEIVDCMVLHSRPERVKVERVKDAEGSVTALTGRLGEREFTFPISLCRELAEYYHGGIPQQYVEAAIDTKFGPVLLYGYVDYVLPFSVHDLKTTGRYSVGNYRDHAQHLVYPYCLWQGGADVDLFEYNIVEIGRTFYNTYTETYAFRPERDVPRLRIWVEDLVDFLEDNRDVITDRKVFALV